LTTAPRHSLRHGPTSRQHALADPASQPHALADLVAAAVFVLVLLLDHLAGAADLRARVVDGPALTAPRVFADTQELAAAEHKATVVAEPATAFRVLVDLRRHLAAAAADVGPGEVELHAAYGH